MWATMQLKAFGSDWPGTLTDWGFCAENGPAPTCVHIFTGFSSPNLFWDLIIHLKRLAEGWEESTLCVLCSLCSRLCFRWQTSTSARGTLCSAAEASVSTRRAASSVFAPRDTRSPPMGRPVQVRYEIIWEDEPQSLFVFLLPPK